MDRYLGLDIGTKTIGVAISDPLKIISQPVETKFYPLGDFDAAISTIKELITKYKISKIIYGLPLNMDGTTSSTTDYVNKLIAQAKIIINIPFIPMDERWTSISATKLLVRGDFKKSKRKNMNHQIAASIILKTYLSRQQK